MYVGRPMYMYTYLVRYTVAQIPSTYVVYERIVIKLCIDFVSKNTRCNYVGTKIRCSINLLAASYIIHTHDTLRNTKMERSANKKIQFI